MYCTESPDWKHTQKHGPFGGPGSSSKGELPENFLSEIYLLNVYMSRVLFEVLCHLVEGKPIGGTVGTVGPKVTEAIAKELSLATTKDEGTYNEYNDVWKKYFDITECTATILASLGVAVSGTSKEAVASTIADLLGFSWTALDTGCHIKYDRYKSIDTLLALSKSKKWDMGGNKKEKIYPLWNYSLYSDKYVVGRTGGVKDPFWALIGSIRCALHGPLQNGFQGIPCKGINKALGKYAKLGLKEMLQEFCSQVGPIRPWMKASWYTKFLDNCIVPLDAMRNSLKGATSEQARGAAGGLVQTAIAKHPTAKHTNFPLGQTMFEFDLTLAKQVKDAIKQQEGGGGDGEVAPGPEPEAAVAGSNTLWWILGGGAAVVGAVLLAKKLKKRA